MSPVKKQLVEMIDFLPEQEQLLLMEIVRRFMPDDIATTDDIKAIHLANEEYARGTMIRHEDVNWD